MDISQILEWLSKNKDAIATLGVIAGIIGSIIGGIWVWKKNRKPDSNPTTTNTTITNYTSEGDQFIAPFTVTNGATVKDVHIGDTHHHYGDGHEKTVQLITELASKLISKFYDWLIQHKKTFRSPSAIGKISVFAIIFSYLIVYTRALKKKLKLDSNPTTTNTTNSSQDHQVNVSISPTGKATVNGTHIGDTYNYNYGYDDEKVAQLAAKLAQEFRKEDTETIKALKATVKALTEQPANQHSIKEALDMLSQGQTELAENIFARIALEARQKGKDAQLEEAAALRHIGSLAYLHDTQKALKSYQRSTELDPDNMDGWNELGHLYLRIGELTKSENAYLAILKLAQTDQEYQAVAYGNLGKVYKTLGELDQAAEYYQKSLGLFQALGAKEGMANQYIRLGNVYLTRGELDQAVEYYQKSLGLFQALGAKEGMASDYGNLGIVYQIRGDLDKAVEYFQKSLALNQEVGNKEGIAINYGILGEVYRTRGELDQAVEYYQKALAIDEALGRKEGMAITYGNLGIVYQTRGELDQAIEYYQKALAIDEALGRKEGMAIQYFKLGLMYQTRGELDKATEFWQKSLALFTEVGMKPQMAQAQSLLDEANPKKAE